MLKFIRLMLIILSLLMFLGTGEVFAQYFGGDADGHALVSKTDVAVCTLPQYSNISKGGNADGHALLTSTCLVGLQIELLYFTAILIENKKVLCEWKTVTETNNDYFTVEKTKEGINYEVVGRLNGAGNSTTTLDYSMTDESPYSGTSYYRLKQTDYDGQFEYSRLVTVNLEGLEIITIYPNPAVDKFEYIIGSTEKMTLQVKVMDVLGQIVINKTENVEKGIVSKKLNVSELNSGTYILQIITENIEIRSKQFQIK